MERRLSERNEILLPARMSILVFVFFILQLNVDAALSSYTFTTLTGVSLADTTGSTQLIGTNQDNVSTGVSAVTSIGFTFNFNGTNYTQFSVNENGLLRLGATAVSVGSTTANSLASSSDLPKITAYFDDLKTVAGTVKYKLLGTAPNRKLVVQWNVTIKGPNSSNSKFQVWLQETSNNITFVYGNNMVANSALYSVGIVGLTTTDFQSISTATHTSSTVTVNNSNTVAIDSARAYIFAASAPGCTTTPSPASGATNVSVSSATLSWAAGTGNTTGYNVYFGTAASPPLVSTNQPGTTYSPGVLTPGAVYYWKVLPLNYGVQNSSCSVLQFTAATAPSCPNITSPAAGATGVTYNNPTLSWTSGSANTTGYDVYFGTTTNPPLVSANQAGTTYSAGVLSPNSVYYWKVLAKNGALTSSCTEIQFTTASTISFDVSRFTGITFNSISSTGNTVASWKNSNNTDDNLSTAIPIGFNFNYGNSNYSSFLVSTNGFITFNTSTSATGGTSSPYGYTDDVLSNYSANPSTLVLAPFYNDLVCQGNSNQASGLAQSIHYSLTGAPGSRVLTVEWTGMELFVTAGPDFNFQIKLYEGTNVVEFVYGTMQGFNGTFNSSYSFSVGLNGAALSSPPVSGEVFNQLTINTRNFGLTPSNANNTIPECNSKLQFTPGNYTPYVPVSAIPVNDNSANAIVLPVNSIPCIDLCGTIYSSQGGTTSGIVGCSSTNADDDVWFKFTANSTGSTTIKLLSSGNYDGTLELFNSALVSQACANATGAGMTESITSNLTIGQLYYIRVFHRFSGSGGSVSSGQFSICVSATPPPPVNDECANKINLPVNQTPVYTAGTSTYSATPSPGIPSCSVAGTNPDDDVWYSFTAVNTTETITVVGGTGFDAVVQLFSGSCGALSAISCVDLLHNGQTETLTANNLIRNAVYYVRVYHAGVGGGSGSYSIAVTSPPPACVIAMAPNNFDVDIPSSGTDLYWDSVPGADFYRIKLDTVFPPQKIIGITAIDEFMISSGPMVGGKTYYWRVEPGNGTGFNTSCQVFQFTTENTPINLKIRAFLESIYTGNQTMLPLINPLDTLADTITVSLADSSKNIVYSQNVNMSIHGWGTAHFPLGTYEANWYIVLDHRNSLEIWSTDMFGIFSADTLYDFSNSASKAYGNNQKQLEPGVFGIHVGDINQDGLIDTFDMDLLIDDSQLFLHDNLLGDMNGDGYAESVDYSILENKIPLNLSVQIPF